jgi:hypothetical protein
MGVRGELFSTRIILPNRTYFFNVKENRMGDLYLNIVESKNRETGGFDRQSVILFADDLQQFLKGFDESLKVMEKAVREKKYSSPPKRDGEKREGVKHEGLKREVLKREERHKERPRGHDHRPESGKRDGRKFDGGKRDGGRHESGRREGGRRVVVKKKFNHEPRQ